MSWGARRGPASREGLPPGGSSATENPSPEGSSFSPSFSLRSPHALSVKGRALRCLAQREHSRRELERKLLRHMQDLPEASAAAQIAAALDDLAAKGLLSDARAAESLLAGSGQRFGVRRLQQVLQFKGLAPELVEASLQTARATELARASEIWRRRFGQPPADAGERARQMRFLAGRGFESDVIRRVIQAAEDD